MSYSTKINAVICIMATLITLHRFCCYRISRKMLQSMQSYNDQESHLVFPLKNVQNYRYRYKEFFYDVYKRSLSDFEKDPNERGKINEENSNKKYLQKILEENDDEELNTEDVGSELPYGNAPWGLCNLETMEVSLNLNNCGRITFNTTACSGFCKSNEQIITNTRMKKRSCWACKPYKFVNIKYEIKCIDNTKSVFNLRAISACSCFKHSDVIVPLASK